ncbi:hypothetical protein Tco_1063984 [Tanacetum coccineum]
MGYENGALFGPYRLSNLGEDHLAKFHKMTDAKEMWDAIKSRFGGNDELKKMQKYILKQQFEGFSVSNLEGLHKDYDRFQSLLSQLEIHRAGVSTKDANQKFLRSLPSAWSQVSLIMWTNPGVDSLGFDDLNDSSKNEMVKEESKEEVRRRVKRRTPDEEKEVDYEILDRKYPIKEWKIECLGIKPQDDKAEHLEEINQNVVIRRVYTLVTEAGLVIHMLLEKKYHLRKKVLVQMLKLKLESEEDSTMTLELIRFVKKLLVELEPEDVDGDEEDL